MKRGRPKKGGRVVDKNIKVTPETLEEVREVATFLGITHSEAISMGLAFIKPMIESGLEKRDAIKEELLKRTKKSVN